MISFFAILAQEAAGGEGAAKDPPSFLTMYGPLVPFLLMAALAYFMLILPQKRQRSTRQAMLAGLKKNDRVVTLGGMIGTVANISPEGTEFTLKVDENTRIRMLRESIDRVLSTEEPAEKPAAT